MIYTETCDAYGESVMHTGKYGNMRYIRTFDLHGENVMYTEKVDVYGKCDVYGNHLIYTGTNVMYTETCDVGGKHDLYGKI